MASFAVQIEGHGTSPDDLKETSWRNWYTSVQQGFEEVKSWKMKHLFVAGLSMGGALSTLLISQVQGVDGMGLIAPALRISGILPRLVPLLKYFMKDREIDVEAVQRVYDIKRTKYGREPVSSYHELFKLLKVARKNLNKISIPTLTGTKKIKIAPGTESETIIRLKEEGIENVNGYRIGDQFINLKIKTPKRLNRKQKKLFEELAKLEE